MIDFGSVFNKKISSEFNSALQSVFHGKISSIRGSYLQSEAGDIPIIAGVPRFSSLDGYASSFTFQWRNFAKTQLDSAQGVRLTERDLLGKLQVDPGFFRGKLVLDVGVGVGRHAEYFCKAGAFVLGIDLSESVEQAEQNLRSYPNAAVFQADLFNLPFCPASFDLVYSVGVLHHTPSWQQALSAISVLPKCGSGFLSVWLYGPSFARRDEWIKFTNKIDKVMFLEVCRLLTASHRQVAAREYRLGAISSVVETHFPFSVHHPNLERSLLAAFDGYSPAYHAVTTSEEVASSMERLGYIVRPGRLEASCLGKRSEPSN